MTMYAYREMAGDALRATRQRGDAVMARYFGDAALAGLAGRMRLLRYAAGLRMSSLYKLPQPESNFVDPAPADRSARPTPSVGAVRSIAGIAWRSAMAASAGALGYVVPDAAVIGKTPVAPALSRQHWRAAAASLLQATQFAAPQPSAINFGRLTKTPGLRAMVNNEPAMGSSYRGPGLIAHRLVPAIHAVSAAAVHTGTGTAHTPGFGQTVRTAVGGQTAGDVYLDKAVVGYHLAAAITAEQTRAAARPNISGSAFNSSMAVLRPSGAGL